MPRTQPIDMPAEEIAQIINLLAKYTEKNHEAGWLLPVEFFEKANFIQLYLLEDLPDEFVSVSVSHYIIKVRIEED